jgi:hypothetical protein
VRLRNDNEEEMDNPDKNKKSIFKNQEEEEKKETTF